MKQLDLRVLDILSSEYDKKIDTPDYTPHSVEEIQDLLRKKQAESPRTLVVGVGQNIHPHTEITSIEGE